MFKWIKKYFEDRNRRIELENEIKILNEAFYLIDHYYRSEDRTDDIDQIKNTNTSLILRNGFKKIYG